jgi:hypothetical protein
MLTEYGVDIAAMDQDGKMILHQGEIHGSISTDVINLIHQSGLVDI